MMYKDCKPIKADPAAVWIVIARDGQNFVKLLIVTAANYSIEQAVQYVHDHYDYDSFRVGAVSCGEFKLQTTNHNFYQSDGRLVDQDLFVKLESCPK